jgi:hypothetical protein
VFTCFSAKTQGASVADGFSRSLRLWICHRTKLYRAFLQFFLKLDGKEFQTAVGLEFVESEMAFLQ